MHLPRMGWPVPQRQRATSPSQNTPEGSAAKKIKTVSSVSTQVQATTRNFTEIPFELKIMILKYLDGDAILTLWQASSDFHRLLKQGYELKFWNLIRQESGFSVPDAPQLPTDDELRIMLYVVNWYCQKEFVTQHRELVENMPSAFNAIGWHDPLDIPGLEFSPMATKFIDAGASQRGHFVASRLLAEMAVRAVQKFKHEEPAKSGNTISRDVKGLILNARHAATNLLHPIREVLQDSDLEITRVGIKRENQIVAALLPMKHLKLRAADIPEATDPQWRALVYKANEITAREWHAIKTPLVRLVKQQQVDRITAILETYVPPTPASMAIPAYDQGLENAESLMVGIFPVSVWLKVCANADLETINNVEKTSKLVRVALRSRAADPAWRCIRISLGLEARVVEVDKGIETLLPKPILRSLAFIGSRPFSNFGWIETYKANVKLYSPGYAESMALWLKNLPADVRKYLPQDLIQKYVARHTNAFIEV
ncbi:hypothetical protein FRC05_007673 [Tulasnella sp. 425]|nr:hypothetical protein FRC05_007673 [Tulasnella sp. 425]